MHIKTLGIAFAAAALALTAPITACSSSDTATVPTDVVIEAPATPERVDATMFAAVVATPSSRSVFSNAPNQR